MIPLTAVGKKIAAELASIEKQTLKNYSLSGISECYVKCFIIGEAEDYYFVLLKSVVQLPGYDFVQNEKFRLMKRDLSVIWAYHWL